MKKFIIKGGNPINGEMYPVGNKNSVLKLIPASILFEGDYVLTNVPAISDVQVMLEILEFMGAAVNYYKNESKLKINTDRLNTYKIPVHLAKKVRASVMFVGPLLARFGEVEGVFPGGDKIGPRELKAHFSAFTQFGIVFEGNEWGEFHLKGNPIASHIHLYEPSVTATENAILLASAAKGGVTVIKGAASEPHVQELCLWLKQNGVDIEGIGSSVIYVKGVDKLSAKGKEHKVWPDHIDVCTSAVAAAITNGELTIKGIREEDLTTIHFFYDQLGLDMQIIDSDDASNEKNLFIKKDQELVLKDETWGRIKGVYSQPWYGFPSDLMSVTIVLAMHVKGSCLFFEKIYPDRMAFAASFNVAGGNIITCDPHRIVVNGPSRLKGFKNYLAPDLRAGMAYFLASLAAQGISEINGVEHIYRGYPDTFERYKTLGADIELIE